MSRSPRRPLAPSCLALPLALALAVPALRAEPRRAEPGRAAEPPCSGDFARYDHVVALTYSDARRVEGVADRVLVEVEGNLLVPMELPGRIADYAVDVEFQAADGTLHTGSLEVGGEGGSWEPARVASGPSGSRSARLLGRFWFPADAVPERVNAVVRVLPDPCGYQQAMIPSRVMGSHPAAVLAAPDRPSLPVPVYQGESILGM